MFLWRQGYLRFTYLRLVASTPIQAILYKMAILLVHQSTPPLGVSDGAVPKPEGFNIRI
jgi:hypothetical protein